MRALPAGLAAALALVASSTAAVAPTDLPATALQREAYLASRAVYSVRVTLSATALVERDGTRLPLAGRRVRMLTEQGTAFAVTRDGVLVTAAHVALPTPKAMSTETATRIARGLYLQREALAGRDHAAATIDRWATERFARIEGLRVRSRSVTPAAPGGVAARELPVTLVPRLRSDLPATDETNDITLLRVARPPVLALALGVFADVGLPIAAIGFGGPPAGGSAPAVRPGRLGRSATIVDRGRRGVISVSAVVELGDSGGPVVDDHGRVWGVISIRRARGGGWVTPPEQVRRLLASADLRNDPGPVDDPFRAAMARLWAFDLPGARAALTPIAARRPNDAFAQAGLARVGQLERARYRIARSPGASGMLLAVATVAALTALALAIRLMGASAPAVAARPDDTNSG